MRQTLRPLRQLTRQRRQPHLAARALPPRFGSSARSRLFRPYGLPESEHAASFPELSPRRGEPVRKARAVSIATCPEPSQLRRDGLSWERLETLRFIASG